MNTLTRTIVVLTAVLTLGLGAAGTASAAFTGRTTPAPLTVGTTTVAAPGDVTARATSCNNSRTQYVQVSWKGSTSARVSGYTVPVYAAAGTVLATGQTDAATTSVGISTDKQYVNPSTLTFTVTSRTDYGRTAVSPRKASLPC